MADMFRFLLSTVGGRDCHSFMNRKQRGFNLQIHVLPKHRLMTPGGCFVRCNGWKAIPISLSLHFCDGGDGWVASSKVVRITEWKAFLLVAAYVIE